MSSTPVTPGNFNFGAYPPPGTSNYASGNPVMAGNFNFSGLTSENQYGSGYPTVPNVPGAVPLPTSTPQTTSTNPLGAPSQNPANIGTNVGLSGNQQEVPTADPTLTNQLLSWLQTQIGTGITPYGLSAALPTGGSSGPGQVAAPLDPVTQQLMDFFSTGQSSNPNLQSLSQLAQTGDPINQMPAWQAMVQAAQNQINQGGANVREQMAFTGNLPGSAGAQAMSDYYGNTNLGLTSQLISAQTQAQQQAVQNQLAASQGLEGAEQQLGGSLYGYDQQAITNLMNEYFQTTPQENPLNQEMFSGATTYPPTYGKPASPGILGSLISGASAAGGPILSSLGDAGLL